MGNAPSSTDEEGVAATVVLAEAAAAGARQAVANEFDKARAAAAGGAGAGAGSGAGGGSIGGGGAREHSGAEIPVDDLLIGGVLSLVDGQNAAAEGAIRGVQSMQKHLRTAIPGDRSLHSDVLALETAAASGSAAGMRVVAMMAARERHAARVAANPDVEDPVERREDHAALLIEAASTGARAAALSSRLHLAAAAGGGGGGGSHARYATLLGPFLGGALPAACAAYHLVKHSPEWIKGVVFGSISLAFFTASIGVITGSLGTTSDTKHSRCAAIATFTAVWFLFSFVMSSLFSRTWGKILSGFLCGLSVAVFLYRWLRRGW